MVVAAEMNEQPSILWSLIAQFLVLSLLAVGGGNAIIPEMHRQVVDIERWMTDRQFADLFAIAQVAPGPNIIIVTLVGFQVAGLAGGIVATAAMAIPSCLLAFAVGQVWQRFREAAWRNIAQAGIVPLSVGLVAATSLIIAVTVSVSWVAVALMAATGAVAYFTRFHPLWMFLFASVLGYAGLV
jgi:chromate transporter